VRRRRGEEARGAGRTLYERSTGARFKYTRWNQGGDQLLAVTGDRLLLTLDVKTGAVRGEEPLPFPGAGPYDSLIGAALSADGSLQAYSVTRLFSDLYEASGLR
jgi:hypothetical protein